MTEVCYDCLIGGIKLSEIIDMLSLLASVLIPNPTELSDFNNQGAQRLFIRL